jgi:CRP/FNR family transcriptional regulator, cyclic AMP receptor protein
VPIDRLDALARVPLLAALSHAQLRELAEVFREQIFEPGSTVIREGERGARVLAFFIVMEGAATVSRGGQQIAVLGQGEHFGEIALFNDVPRRATVTASTELRCLAISSWEFRPFVESHPEVAWRLLESMAERLGTEPS